MGDSESGCEKCSASKTQLVQVGKDLKGIAIDWYVPEDPSWRTTYQNDLLHQCTSCGAMWLQQYWECDTPETEFEEFGVRHWSWSLLDAGQVSAIDSALDSGQLLPHGHFRAE